MVVPIRNETKNKFKPRINYSENSEIFFFYLENDSKKFKKLYITLTTLVIIIHCHF